MATQVNVLLPDGVVTRTFARATIAGGAFFLEIFIEEHYGSAHPFSTSQHER